MFNCSKTTQHLREMTFLLSRKAEDCLRFANGKASLLPENRPEAFWNMDTDTEMRNTPCAYAPRQPFAPKFVELIPSLKLPVPRIM